MARALRIDVPGGFYHAMARGLERRRIFPSEAARRHWLGLLAELPERFAVRLHAWVMMENHYHLQIETPEANLSRAMQWLNVSYASWFNRKHRRAGPLFQGRFRAELTDTEIWVAEVNRYIHLNPVRTVSMGLDKRGQAEARAGARAVVPEKEIVRERLRILREYPWSSCRAYLGLEKAPSWLTVERMRAELGGKGPVEQIGRYRSALEESLREGREDDPWERALGGAILGGKKFVEKMKGLLGKPAREVPGSRVLDQRWSFEDWRETMEGIRGECWDEMAVRYGDPARDLVLLAARSHGGLALKELGSKVDLDYGTVANALHRIRQRIERDRPTRRQWKQLLKCYNQKT